MATTQTAPEKGKTFTPSGKTPTPPAAGTGTPTAPTLAMQAKGIVDIVEARVQQFIQSGQLDMPKDYSVENAMKSAWLILQTVEAKVGSDYKKALQVCTRDSIANSLLDMVVQGLNPGKKQGYFIAYGQQLTFQRSYFGSMAVAKMVNPKIDDFAYAVVYEGDTFKYGIKHGKKTVDEHVQDIKNVQKDKIIAAYCIALDKAGEPMKTEIMTFDEIKQAWQQSKTKPVLESGKIKEDSTHGKFTADMALKTVINKTCKVIINASSDNTLLLERINRAEDLADAAVVGADIAEHANTGDLVQISETTVIDEQAGEVTGPGSAMEPEHTPPPAEPVCVCNDMTAQKQKEWTCEVHGTYRGGRFTKDLFTGETEAGKPADAGKPQGRKPGF
jgi:recombination protein RecT